MQQITVKEVRGPLGKGERKFYAIKDEKGAEFTSFDAKLTNIKTGSVLEIECEISGKFINIKEWKLISEPPAPAGEAMAVGKVSSAAEIEAHYRIAALECAISLAAVGKITNMNDVKLHADQYYCWLSGKPAPVSGAGTTNKEAPKSVAAQSGSTIAAEKDWEALKSAAEPTRGDLSRLSRTELREAESRELAESTPAAIAPGLKQASNIDLGWLGNSLLTLAARDKVNWSEEAVIASMDRAYGVIGQTALEKAARLEMGKAKHFEQKVREALKVPVKRSKA